MAGMGVLLGLAGGPGPGHRRQFKAALRTRNAQFTTIFQAIPDGVIMVRPQGVIQLANDGFVALFGYSLAELPQVPYGRLFAGLNDDSPQGGPKPSDLFSEKSYRSGEVLCRRHNGQTFWAKRVGVTVESPEGCVLGFLVIIHDVSQRRQAQQALMRSEQRSRTLVGNLPGVVYRLALNHHRTMLFVSDGTERLTGYPASDFLSEPCRSLESLVPPADR